MKKIAINLFILFAALFISKAEAQTISPLLFGQNAWMPDSIGKTFYNGKLHKNWGKIGASGAELVRFGGIAPDYNMPTNHQYVKMVDSVRSKGMEIMLQVPFAGGQYNASQAAAIVKYVNITMGKHVKYWIIGNEPNLKYSYTNSTQVAIYLKSFSSAMKAVDPSIIIVGPETAWFDRNIINGLTTPDGPDDVTGKDANGHYYVDIISFHTYPFSGGQNRGQVLSTLTGSNGFEQNLQELSLRVQNCNTVHGRTGAAAVKMAVTECNIDYANPSNDDLNGTGGQSFVGGQFWAEMLGIAMKKGVEFVNFWSTIEGGNNVQDIGYVSNSTGKVKPSYYHFQMMAQNFKGSYLDAKGNQPNVKSFASKSGNQIAVMIMNQDQVSNFAFTLNLDGTTNGSSMLKISVNAGASKPYTGTIDNQSSIVLVFDLAGNILKKIEYKLNGHADANLPPTVTNYAPVSNNNGNGGNGTGGATTGIGANGKMVIPFHTFPNPMKDSFTIEASTEAGSASVEMYNSIGQMVSRKKFDVSNGLFHQKIALDQNMAAGMYIVEVKLGEETHTAKMVLAK